MVHMDGYIPAGRIKSARERERERCGTIQKAENELRVDPTHLHSAPLPAGIIVIHVDHRTGGNNVSSSHLISNAASSRFPHTIYGTGVMCES
jgi:hypothetical protein